MFQYKDQLGNTISLREKPQRIISIVPSQSEFLWDLGLKNELAGITKFCIHPHEMFSTVQRVGGTKNLDLDKIRQLKPDLIIGNKEENEQSQIEALQKEFRVWMSDIYNFEDALNMMSSLGEIFDKKQEADAIISNISASLSRIKNIFSGQRAAYFIWNDPYLLAARHTFIDHVLNYLGFENTASQLARYPEVSDEALQQLNPEFCFLSSEPFPFKEKHVKELQAKLPGSEILIVDGEMFSWYGSRLLGLEKYARELEEMLG